MVTVAMRPSMGEERLAIRGQGTARYSSAISNPPPLHISPAGRTGWPRAAWRGDRRRLPDDERNETVLARVHGTGTDTTAGADSGDQQGVHAERGERGRQRRAEESARVLLGDHGFPRRGLEPLGECRQLRVGACHETLQCRHLAEEDSAVAASVLVAHVGVHIGCARAGPPPAACVPRRARVPPPAYSGEPGTR